jgi:hypothetical protein
VKILDDFRLRFPVRAKTNFSLKPHLDRKISATTKWLGVAKFTWHTRTERDRQNEQPAGMHVQVNVF